MSSPHVVVAAVHEPDSSLEEWWKDNCEMLDGFEKEYAHNDEVDWRFCTGVFKSLRAVEELPVEAAYHSGRGEDVIEILLHEKDGIENIQLTGLEDVIEEINYRFDRSFTLEVYYWYDGVDKPGGVPRDV